MSFVRTCSLAVALAVGASAVGAAQQPRPTSPTTSQAPAAGAGLKVAFINVGALLKGMPGYTQAESTWTKEAAAAQEEARKIRAVFDSAVANYQQSQAMMTPSNRTAREKALTAQGDTVQSKLQALQNKIAARERELMAPMQERLKAIIEGVRAEGNYALIIDLASEASENIVSYDRSLDITVRVAQRLAQSPSN